MAKRKTKKQKQKAKQSLLRSYKLSKSFLETDPKKPKFEANVKGQFKKSNLKRSDNTKPAKITNHSAKYTYLKEIRTDIIKSLILASLIIASEVMLYLALSK